MTLDAAIEERIRDAPLSAHLATSVNDRPHVAPVWYGYRDGTMYVLTGGKKLENVRKNPRTAISIEKADGEGGVQWGVTLLGTITVVDDPARIADAREWIFDAYDQHETDGGENDGADQEGDRTEYALLEIAIGSGTLQVYE